MNYTDKNYTNLKIWIREVTASRTSDASKLKELMTNVHGNLSLFAAGSSAF